MLVLRGRHVTDRAPRLRLNLGSRFMSLKFRVQMSSSCYIDLVFRTGYCHRRERASLHCSSSSNLFFILKI